MLHSYLDLLLTHYPLLAILCDLLSRGIFFNTRTGQRCIDAPKYTYTFTLESTKKPSTKVLSYK